MRVLHTRLRGRLLTMLFLLINCVCTAAPLLSLACEGHAKAVCRQWMQAPGPIENDEECQTATISNNPHLSVRKHCEKGGNYSVVAASSYYYSNSYRTKFPIPDAHNLPLLGYYSFLFRYTLF